MTTLSDMQCLILLCLGDSLIINKSIRLFIEILPFLVEVKSK